MTEYLYKVLVVGNNRVGKTAFLQRYINNTYSAQYKCTLGGITQERYSHPTPLPPQTLSSLLRHLWADMCSYLLLELLSGSQKFPSFSTFLQGTLSLVHPSGVLPLDTMCFRLKKVPIYQKFSVFGSFPFLKIFRVPLIPPLARIAFRSSKMTKFFKNFLTQLTDFRA